MDKIKKSWILWRSWFKQPQVSQQYFSYFIHPLFVKLVQIGKVPEFLAGIEEGKVLFVDTVKTGFELVLDQMSVKDIVNIPSIFLDADTLAVLNNYIPQAHKKHGLSYLIPVFDQVISTSPLRDRIWLTCNS